MKRNIIIVIILISQVIKIYSQEKRYIRKGNKYYFEKNYQQAEIMYQKAIEKNFSSKEANFNLGNTFYREEKYDAAIQKYENVAITSYSDSLEKSKHYYNLGNAYFKNQKIKESIDAYKKALKFNPYDYDTKHNLQLAIFMIKNQNQGNQKNNNNNNKKDNNENKDNQSQNQQQHQNQQQQKQNENQNNQQNGAKQNKPNQISKEDAIRLLNEINRREKEILQQLELQKRQLQKTSADKNW